MTMKLKLLPRSTLKGAIAPRSTLKGRIGIHFPGTVSGISPVEVNQSGGNYSIGIDINTLEDLLGTGGGTISGTGTDNHVVRWDGTGDIQDSSAIISDAGTLAINPTTATTSQGIAISQTGPSTGSMAGNLQYNSIVVADGAAVTGDDRTWAFLLQYFVRTNSAGNKYGLGVELTHDQDADLEGDRIALIPRAIASALNTGTFGGLYGANPQAIALSGAIGITEMSGLESSVRIDSGASASRRFGFAAVNTGDLRGTIDAAFKVGSVSAGGAFENLLYLDDDFHGAAALSTTASILKPSAAKTIGTGIDLSSYTITGDFLKSSGFSVNGSGTVSGAQYNIGAIKVLSIVGNDTVLSDPEATDRLRLGNSTSPFNIYDNTNHSFRNRAGTANFVTITAGGVAIHGATSGSITLAVPAAAGSNQITFPAGSTDFSATGGSGQVIKQLTAGGAFTVATIAAGEIASGAALTKVDDTNVTLTLGGTPTTALLQAASLTLGWNGTLAPSRGGTGASTLTGLLQGNGTSAITGIANSSTVGQVLRVTGASSYAWGALDLADTDAITGDLPYANLTPSANASRLLGRQSGSAGDWEEITLGTNLSMSGTTLNATAGAGGYSVIQEEGSGLTARTTLNFVGGGFTAADDGANTRTNVTLDATLNALAAYNTNGLLTQTAADTFAGRTITGTTAQITVTDGDGVAGNPTLSFPSDILVPTVLTIPNTGLHLLDTDATHDLIVKPGSNLTADRTLTVTTGDTDMTVNLTAVTDEFVLAYDTGTNTWRGVAATGGTPTLITVANEAADTTCFVAFFTAATGDLGPKTNTNMTFNSSTGVVTFASSVLTTTDINGGTIDGTVIGGASAAAITGTNITANTNFLPDANDGAGLGVSGTAFSDLFLASGAVIDFAAANVVLTHSTGILNVTTGDLRVTTAGTNAQSAVTVGGTQTLTSKTLTSPTITTSPTAAGATWTDLGTVTTADINGGTLDNVVIGGATAAAATVTTLVVNTSANPDTNDGAVLGATATRWSDLFLADGAVIDMGTTASRATITHVAASDSITIAADPDNATASSAINFSVDGTTEASLNSTNFTPGANDGNALGVSGTAWADLFLASGAVIDFAAANAVLTHSTGILNVTTGDLRVTTAGTNAQSVVTVGGTQTLTSKTLTSPTITTSPTAAGATWADLGTITIGTFANTGLHIFDTDSTHDLIIVPGSNLTADRTLTVTTGDASVTLNLTAVTDEFVLAYDTGTNTWRGVAATGGTPTLITVANEATDTTCFPAFFTAATGDLGPKTNANLTYNSNTGAFSIGTAAVFTAGTIELGAASDTTLARVSAGVVSIEGSNILTEATAEAFVESAIDTLANLTSIQGFTVTFADAGFDVLSGWDDSAAAHKNFLLADILTEAAPAAGDFVLIYGAEGDFRKVNWSGLPGVGGGISNVVEDTSPTLGGDLEDGGFDLITTGEFGIERDDASTNTILNIFNLQRTSSGTPANNIGVSLAFDVETGVGNIERGCIIEVAALDVTSTSEDFALNIKLMQAGAAATDIAGFAWLSGEAAFYLGDVRFGKVGGTYSTFYDPEETAVCDFGDTGDPTSYYSNTSHRFRSRGAASTLAFLNSTGLIVGGSASPDRLLHAEQETAATNTVTYVERLTSTSSGTPAVGIGVGLEFEVETAATPNLEVGATIEAVAYDVTGGSEDFSLNCKQMAAGVLQESEGVSFLFKSLTANAAYTNNNTVQQWFSSGGAISVEASTSYEFEGQLLQTNGTTSHTVGLSFTGTATLTSIGYVAWFAASLVNATITGGNTTQVNQASNTVVTAAITTAGTVIQVRGIVRINAAGTFIPNFTFSAAPGVGNILANTFFKMRKFGSNTNATQGPWA